MSGMWRGGGRAAVFCHKCGERLDASGDANPVRLMPETNPEAAAPDSARRRPTATMLRAEEELWRGGYSPKAMIGAWVISGAISLVLLIVGILWVPREAAWWLALLVAMLLPWLYHARRAAATVA